MRDDLAAQLLSKVLAWDPAQFAAQGRDLQFLARYKYDSYEGYAPGLKFIESLATWLWQFEPDERKIAIDFVLHGLVVIARDEIDHVIETVYPDLIRPRLSRRVAAESGIPHYRVSEIARSTAFADLQRKTLIFGLADGARLDRLRRSSPELSHEQFYLNPELSDEAYAGMQTGLANAITQLSLQPPAMFREVLLIDDFAGSGYTLLGRDAQGEWRGKLIKAARVLEKLTDAQILASDVAVCIVLYVASEQAAAVLRQGLKEAALDWQLIVVQPIADRFKVTNQALLTMCEKYFDEAILDVHLAKGDQPPYLGFGGARLPLVLHHNTPNNSIGLLWADTSDRPGTERRHALFPRRQRHNPERP